jgi:CubicO group peptidase (beta-lactamase class C family)
LHDEWLEARRQFLAKEKAFTRARSAQRGTVRLAVGPGSTQVCNNSGYYLLGRIVAKLRNRASPADAFSDCLLKPLGITQIRRAASLVSATGRRSALPEAHPHARHQPDVQ